MADIASRNFVLVHGAWHGGWCYKRVAELLRAKGHRVFTPTLTGLGERSHLARYLSINCSTHIQDVANLIRWEELTEVVLCGHSYGGMVIGGVADTMPGNIASLIHLDSAIPEDGKSLFDLLDSSDINAAMIELASSNGGSYVPPFPAARYGINASDESLVDRLCTAQPLASMIERIHLTGAYRRVRKKTYILATKFPGSTNRRFYESVSSDPDWATFEVACGHDVMLDAPERLAEILLSRV
jgi:pimeloyl-ACP methyl ester carboxylesterase